MENKGGREKGKWDMSKVVSKKLGLNPNIKVLYVKW